MNASSVFRLVLALVIVAGVALLGVGIYQTGVAAGLAADGGAAATAVPYYGWGPGWGPGFGFFGFLGFLFFLFLLFGLIRAVTWGGRGRGGRGWGDPGRWESRRREMFDDWHRRAHEGEVGSPQGGGGQRGEA